jgi:hypothetical protein
MYANSYIKMSLKHYLGAGYTCEFAYESAYQMGAAECIYFCVLLVDVWSAKNICFITSAKRSAARVDEELDLYLACMQITHEIERAIVHVYTAPTHDLNAS